MALLVFAALIVTTVFAITWGTTAAALRQSRQEQAASGAGCAAGPPLHSPHSPRRRITTCGHEQTCDASAPFQRRRPERAESPAACAR
jgi:hypothetical protein